MLTLVLSSRLILVLNGCFSMTGVCVPRTGLRVFFENSARLFSLQGSTSSRGCSPQPSASSAEPASRAHACGRDVRLYTTNKVFSRLFLTVWKEIYETG